MRYRLNLFVSEEISNFSRNLQYEKKIPNKNPDESLILRRSITPTHLADPEVRRRANRDQQRCTALGAFVCQHGHIAKVRISGVLSATMIDM